MFYDINKVICDIYPSLNPLNLLEYYADDVFELINNIIEYNKNNENVSESDTFYPKKRTERVIRREADDSWF